MGTVEIDLANALRWNRKQRGYYEVYYLKWNDAPSSTAGWVRYTLTSPLAKIGEPYCELWGIFFDAKNPANNFGVRNRFPIEALQADTNPFALRIGDGELTATTARGVISPTGAGPLLGWDLQIRALDEVVRPFPLDAMYRQAGLPTTKVIVPHQNSRFSGTLTIGERTLEFSDAPGQQSHLFGTRHAHRWAWGHCNSFAQDPEAVWEGMDAQVRLGPTLPHFKLFYVKAFGKAHWFNSLPQLVRNQSRWDRRAWSFAAENDEVKLSGEITCRPENFVTVGYMDPNGALLYCHNSKVSDIRLDLNARDGSHLGTLTSQSACAVEFVDRRIYPGMTVHI